MKTATITELMDEIQAKADPLREGIASDYNTLLEQIGNARFVLIGEASHGTHEFYRERAEITKRLISEMGFNAVAVEADFPDAYRVNCYVRGAGTDKNADAALAGFERFPAWMWRNDDILEFADWLRGFNNSLGGASHVGFYGLDLYSLHTSIDAVINYLEKNDPGAAARARERYSCFDAFGNDTQDYAYASSLGLTESCQNAVLQQMLELNRRWADSEMNSGIGEREALFVAEQNGRLVTNAEEYYRTMFRSDVRSWNLRDRHMTETIAEIEKHLSADGPEAKIVVWAHNSHLGDARFTEMGRRGELNVGQLVREKYGEETFLIGFTTHSGTVTAATDWGGPAERKRVRPSLDGSVENLFHTAGRDRFLLTMKDDGTAMRRLDGDFLERAIGVIYRPETERQSHYFKAQPARQFDAWIHIDETSALRPLERTAAWESGELPETFPTGI
ncbi:MAG TPA: erythromycin esterase family protein [Pyrinomonadaceae bacterium]|nr:erythromycin esterase family protein [Pyrinomonadaceae bacterium]